MKENWTILIGRIRIGNAELEWGMKVSMELKGKLMRSSDGHAVPQELYIIQHTTELHVYNTINTRSIKESKITAR